jgi:hypothetical protein
MKKVFKTLLVTVIILPLLAFSSNITYAAERLTSQSEQSFVVTLDNIIGPVAELQVVNEQGTIIHSKKVRASEETVYQPYDFVAMADGNYTFVIRDLMKVESIPFAIINGSVEITQEPEVTFRPGIENGENSINVHLLAQQKRFR